MLVGGKSLVAREVFVGVGKSLDKGCRCLMVKR